MLVKAYGAHASDQPLESLQITRRATGAHDVQIDIAFCGICHSDLHQVRSEWEGTQYPCVPGHEIVGRVAAVGAHVQGFKPGDLVGVVGVGGLGHMGIKLAHAMGAHVVAFTTSDGKRAAARELGADEVVVSRNADDMAAHLQSFDFILNTVAAPHDLDAFLALLKRDGTMTLVGAPPTPHPSPNVFNFIMKRRSLAGSMIGGIPETQEMLDFCAEHGIVADIEMVRADEINAAYERMLKGDVKYRFVIDNATLNG